MAAPAFAAALERLVPTDPGAAEEAAQLSDRLTKPPGSLGRLEALAAQLAAIARCCPPPRPEPAAVAVFAGDHGVTAQGVTPWPQEVTAQMVANFCAGGAAISVLASQAGTRLLVVDVGVASDLPPDLPADRFLAARVRPGTADISTSPAMSPAERDAALEVGASVAAHLAGEGAGCLITGEMGIGNTTPTAALLAALCGTPSAAVTGRGTGVDDATWARKVAVVDAALRRLPEGLDGLDVLAEIGGLEIAALCGFIVAGAAAGLPVVLDGVIAIAAAVVAVEVAPACRGYLIAGHRSTEPGASVGLDRLGLEPLLDLGMRLGEGTGACLALPVVSAAARLLAEMATFDQGGVTDKRT
jgi:nicotinate-nucleotide--dimethylbenzimidazole phosphoribosyltransferase